MKVVSQLHPINKKTVWGFGKTWHEAVNDIKKNGHTFYGAEAYAYEIDDENAHFNDKEELVHKEGSVLILLGKGSIASIKEGLYR
jgi:hypothetical protein